jgi:hypothetical protein
VGLESGSMRVRMSGWRDGWAFGHRE